MKTNLTDVDREIAERAMNHPDQKVRRVAKQILDELNGIPPNSHEIRCIECGVFMWRCQCSWPEEHHALCSKVCFELNQVR